MSDSVQRGERVAFGPVRWMTVANNPHAKNISVANPVERSMICNHISLIPCNDLILARAGSTRNTVRPSTSTNCTETELGAQDAT